MEKLYRVEIVEIKTDNVVAVVGKHLHEAAADRREETAMMRTNLDEYFVRIVEEVPGDQG